jgi:hypothetical protein
VRIRKSTGGSGLGPEVSGGVPGEAGGSQEGEEKGVGLRLSVKSISMDSTFKHNLLIIRVGRISLKRQILRLIL